MEIINKNKGAIAGGVVFLLFLFLYNMLGGAGAALSDANSSPVGADLLELSNELSKASLSTELFSEPAYRLLTDFSTPVPSQPLGRPNPFAVIGQN